MRILLIGTHPSQTTGYSKVVYHLAKNMSAYPEIKFTIFGIQRFTNVNDEIRLDLPKNVSVWDVYAKDKEDYGFGTVSLSSFVIQNDPDIVVVYNDAEVIRKYILNLKNTLNMPENKQMKCNFKIVAYLDQVHKNQNPDTMKYLGENTDHVFCFTEQWKQNYLSYFPEKYVREKQTSVLRHGIETSNSLTTAEAKIKLGIHPNTFIFLNLNRFAQKKRLDISVLAFVHFLKLTSAKEAILYFPALIDENINQLKEIYIQELKRNKLEQFEKNFIVGTSQLSDQVIHTIYKASDVGLNSCDGEGFGLCNYEHAAYGKPQVLSRVGGLLDYFTDENCILCTPKVTTYSSIMEKGEVIDYRDMGEGMAKYYNERSFYDQHAKIVSEIPEKYIWSEETKKFVSAMKELYKK